MAGPDAALLVLAGSIVEAAVVYLVTALAALYLLRTLCRAFRSTGANRATSDPARPREVAPPCARCSGCGLSNRAPLGARQDP